MNRTWTVIGGILGAALVGYLRNRRSPSKGADNAYAEIATDSQALGIGRSDDDSIADLIRRARPALDRARGTY